MQVEPGGGGITINLPTVDWTQLVPELVGLFFDGVGTFLNDTLHDVFDGAWDSGTNVLGHTDPAMVWGFGPVHDQVVSVQGAARAVLLFALIVLGLKAMFGALIARHSDVFGDFVDHVLASVVLVAAFPVVIPALITMTNDAARAVGTADLRQYLSAGDGTGVALVSAVMFLIALVFVCRLLIKAIWRIGLLAVLLPFGMAACVLYAVPGCRWLLSWWTRAWGGLLIAQIPSVFALSIGSQLFAYGGVIGFLYAIAFLQLALDLYDIFPGASQGAGGAPFWSAPLTAAAVFSRLTGAGAAATAARGVAPTAPADAMRRYGYD